MSASLVGAVYQSSLPGKLKPLAAFIAHVVLDDAAAAKKQLPARTFFVSVPEAAHALGLHPESVRAHFHELQRLGVLSLVKRGGGWRRFTNGVAGLATTYEFHPDRLPTGDAGPREKRRGERILAQQNAGEISGPPQNAGDIPIVPRKNAGALSEVRTTGIQKTYREERSNRSTVRRTSAAAQVIEPPPSAVEQRFTERHRAAQGNDPTINPEDRKELARVVRTLKEEHVLRAIDRFFASEDRRHQDRTVQNFCRTAQGLAVALHRPHINTQNLDAAARAMRSRPAQEEEEFK